MLMICYSDVEILTVRLFTVWQFSMYLSYDTNAYGSSAADFEQIRSGLKDLKSCSYGGGEALPKFLFTCSANFAVGCIVLGMWHG